MDHYNCAMVINRRFKADNEIETVSPAKSGKGVSKLLRAVSLHIKAACFSEFLAVIYSSEVSELGCKLVKFDQIEGKWQESFSEHDVRNPAGTKFLNAFIVNKV